MGSRKGIWSRRRLLATSSKGSTTASGRPTGTSDSRPTKWKRTRIERGGGSANFTQRDGALAHSSPGIGCQRGSLFKPGESSHVSSRSLIMSEHHATIDWKRETADFDYETYNRDHDWTFDAGATVR